jgi:ribosomal RNA assembly protein
MQFDSIKVPASRIAVLIGKNGETKKEIEEKTKTKILIDSEENNVEIESTEKSGLGFYSALNIIKAIARGFSPEHAFLLLDDKYYLEIIDLSEKFGKSKNKIFQRAGRVIGTKGKMRSEIEETTECFVSVQGKTIAIIGEMEKIELAKKAVTMMIEGATHDSVLRFLRKSEIRTEEFEL